MLRILYAGSPAASAKTLELLFNASANGDASACGKSSASAGDSASASDHVGSFEIVGVLTNPPRSQGRHKTLVPTPVQDVAEKHGIKVFSPEHLDADVRAVISETKPDMLVCFAYGKIFGPKFMALFKYGGINLHPSLLPRYRGPTPVNATIFNRDVETAATVQTLAQKMDEGDILAQEKIALDGTETAGALLEKSAEIGARLLAEVIAETAKNDALPAGRPQEGEASYTTMMTKESGHIDWNRDEFAIDAQIRACTPEPGAWTSDTNGVIKILKARVAVAPLADGSALANDSATGEKNPRLADASALAEASPLANASAECGTVLSFEKSVGIMVATGDGVLIIEQLQRQGKSAMSAKDFMNGARNFVGSKLM